MSQVPPPPPLPAVGDLNWGPQVNDALVWLYQQHVENLAAIEANRSNIAALMDQVNVLEARPDFVYDSGPWTYHNGTPPSPAGQIRCDSVDPTQATLLDVRLLDLEGADRTPWFKQLNLTSQVRIADWDDASRYHRFRVLGQATFSATNAQFPVAWVAGAGSIASNQKAVVGVLIDVSAFRLVQ